MEKVVYQTHPVIGTPLSPSAKEFTVEDAARLEARDDRRPGLRCIRYLDILFSGCRGLLNSARDWKDDNPRGARTILMAGSVMLLFFAWIYFFFNYLYSSGSTFITWFPGMMGTLGFVWLNVLRFPKGNTNLDLSDGPTRAEVMYLLAICWTALPILIAFFFLSVDMKEGYEDGIGAHMLVQTICIFLGGVGSSYGATMTGEPYDISY